MHSKLSIQVLTDTFQRKTYYDGIFTFHDIISPVRNAFNAMVKLMWHKYEHIEPFSMASDVSNPKS